MKLFTPGPIAMDEQTISLGGTQAQYFRTPEFSRLMLECAAMLKTALDAPDDARMIFLTASGTGAMEAAVMNLFTPRDKVLVISGGTFGQRFRRICEIHEIPAEVIELRWDEAFKPEMLERYENSGITGMLVNMCETSTGQLYPMEVFSTFCKRNGVCLVVDAISSFLCDPFSMKKTNADAVIVSSQKGLALHPGMSFAAIRKEAFEKRCANNSVKSLYFNFKDYEQDIIRGQTPYTPAVGVINQMHDKLCRLLKEGVENHIRAIKNIAVYCRGRLRAKTEFTIPEYPLSNGVTPVYCPSKNAKDIFEFLKNSFDVYVTPCAGDIAPVLFRVAHMSRQISEKDIDRLIALLSRYGEKK
jgi:aspartate aminotransferase-like enzyme